MKQRRLHYLRLEAGLSMRSLGNKCTPPVSATYICNGERWGHMYESHLVRLAKALEYDGNPIELMDEIEVKAVC